MTEYRADTVCDRTQLDVTASRSPCPCGWPKLAHRPGNEPGGLRPGGVLHAPVTIRLDDGDAIEEMARRWVERYSDSREGPTVLGPASRSDPLFHDGRLDRGPEPITWIGGPADEIGRTSTGPRPEVAVTGEHSGPRGRRAARVLRQWGKALVDVGRVCWALLWPLAYVAFAGVAAFAIVAGDDGPSIRIIATVLGLLGWLTTASISYFYRRALTDPGWAARIGYAERTPRR